MFSTRFSGSVRSLFYFLGVFCLTATVLFFVSSNVDSGSAAAQSGSGPVPEAPSAIFPANAGSLGAIPDGPGPGACGVYTGTPRDVTFTASGLSGTIADVRVNMTFAGPAHTWRGDLSVVLIAPGGSPTQTIFHNTGSTTAGGCGSGNDVAGPYVFFDTAAPAATWWLTAGTPTPAGNYKASTPGGVPGGGADTTITPTFAGLGAAANGTWTLRFLDGGIGDTGAVSAASLEITTSGSPTPTPLDALADFDGDSRTDYSVIRTLAGPSGQATWHTSLNASGVPSSRDWGVASDTFVPADFDGDGRDDIAVWRPGVQGTFYIIRSSDSTIRVDDFGVAGDDASVVGDYNNDGTDDLAVYRSGSTPGSFSHWYWKSGGTVYSVQWGLNGDFVAPGDYDGDGARDYVVQRANGANSDYYLRYSSGIPSIVTTFGNAGDLVVPGDYDGDLKTDLCGVRTSGADWVWSYRKSSNSAVVNNTWGLHATDIPAPGDYDGDGKADYAVWRFGALSTFFVMRPETLQISSRQWGLVDDNPATMTYTH